MLDLEHEHDTGEKRPNATYANRVTQQP